jgi:zinc protease
MKKISLLILIFIFSISLAAQVDRTKKPEPGPPPEIQLGKYETFTLDNGLKVFVVENDKLPVVSFSLVVDRDPILEGEYAGYLSIAGAASSYRNNNQN